MRLGLDRAEVTSLAKTMEVKFAVCGPDIGGAKSGINFDSADPRKPEVLRRWFKAITPILKNYYGTGGDLNIDEIKDVIPVTENFGIVHPQEGIINGHFQPNEAKKIDKIAQLRRGVSKSVKNKELTPEIDKYTVADLITGFGVSEAIRHFYNIWEGEITGKKAIIQGWGNVGAAAAFYLASHGVKIIAASDKDGGIINEDGYSLEEVKTLFLNRDSNKLVSDQKLDFQTMNEKIWSLGADIFIPAAASRIVTKEQIKSLINGGLEVISCGANVPFKEDEIFFGPLTRYADENLALIPDFIANCGMARVFAYLMEDHNEVREEAIFSDVSEVINKALKNIYSERNQTVGITGKAFEKTLSTLV